MKNLDSIFRGKKITQMGLGLLGRGVGDADFLARHGAELIVTDMKSATQLKQSLDTLAQYPITFHLDGHTTEDFMNRDLVLKGAGVPLRTPYIETARAHGVPVDMSASLFARIARIPMVGVTGTRGKSTVTILLERILTADGRNTLLGGNIKGVSNLALLGAVKPDTIGVFELDSWQCQGFGEEKTIAHPHVEQGPRSPELAVFTTFMPDHLNYYKNDLDTYLHDKANIFLYQTDADVLIVGRQALPALEKYRKNIKSHVYIADEHDVPKKWNIPLIGLHNRYNVGVAVVAARSFGISDDVIQMAVESMTSLEGRLELITTYKGIPIYNDTNATTPDATYAALAALGHTAQTKRIILIAGGADKDLDMSKLAEGVLQWVKACVWIPGSGTSAFLEKRQFSIPSAEVTTLPESVTTALSFAQKGDVILFSPAFASFGMFKNEYDRGEQFIEIIRSLL